MYLWPDIMENPGNIHYEQMEHMADEIVKNLANQPNMTYQKAYDVLVKHKEVIAESIDHLNHNAGIEMAGKPLNYVLNPKKNKR